MHEIPRRVARLRACRIAGLVALIAATGMTVTADGALASTQSRTTAQAVRIELKPRTVTYTVGTKPDLVLTLLDPKGAPFTAPKDFVILIEVLATDGKVVHNETVTVKKGQSVEKFDLDIEGLTLTGPIRVRATNRELLEGGTVLYAQPKAKPGSRRPPAFEPRWDIVPARLELSPAPGCGGNILVSPARTMMADARDAAELTVVVDPVRRRTQFFLNTTLGQLSTNPIVIDPETPVGKTQLTSDSVGEATITCVRTVPALSASETTPVTVRFKQPVAGFELSVTPPQVPWIDRAGVLIRLFREGGATITTDEKRRISLSRESGSGEIQPEVVDIEPGEFEGRATFLPYQKGSVRISAAMSGFVSQHVDLEILALPYLMFLLPTIGGLCGGLVALARPRAEDSAAEADSLKASWTSLHGPLARVLVGIVTGTMLHWALVFGVLPILPRQVVMSLFSWFFLPLIGGWLGTEVFRLLLNQLGIGAKATA